MVRAKRANDSMRHDPMLYWIRQSKAYFDHIGYFRQLAASEIGTEYSIQYSIKSLSPASSFVVQNRTLFQHIHSKYGAKFCYYHNNNPRYIGAPRIWGFLFSDTSHMMMFVLKHDHLRDKYNII